MNIIEFKDVAKSHFTQKLYENVNLEINEGDKIAIVGNNGSGKTTLLKLINEDEHPTYGDIIIEEGTKIAYFDQFGKISLDKSVKELLDSPFEHIIKAQTYLEEVSTQFTGEAENDEKVMEEFQKASDLFESLGAYDYLHLQSEFIDVFELVGALDRNFKDLSGGEKQYVRLAITLFKESNLVMLDEPLSYFDKKKTAWLANFIAKSSKAFLVISHNVDFIRPFSNKFFDVDNFRVTTYEGDYRTYQKEKKVQIKEEKKENKEKDIKIQEMRERIRKKEILLERVEDKRSHAVALRRMEKELEELEKGKIVHSEESKYAYSSIREEYLTINKDIGDVIVSVNNVSKEFPEKVLYKDVNFEILKNSKMCIVGENGSGKSTLLKMILGEEAPTTGTIDLNPKVKFSYIGQENILKDENMRIVEYVQDKTGLNQDFIEETIDSLFNYEEEFRSKKLYMLSGGEKKRLEIFTNILAETHLLVIDEPSTYMDGHSRSIIANMLNDYEGAVILVTHDKELLRMINFEMFDIRDRLFREKQRG
ncbi:ABC-F family ATP-binding cassette domain-containing protein [Fusobacterium sp. MFO224]|uniref:ABC-F family ATP-binding cassette domain-containing protein n=1 Tax=Fusobacterium sp. MFO224 TaxID=3378070 RepID=UPI0038533279